MTREERARGRALLRLGAAVLFAFPGAPTVYYGDEAGMEGYEDPFNRRTYPWGHEDRELVSWFSALGRQRRTSDPLRRGALRWGTCRGALLSFARCQDGRSAGVAVNRGQVEMVAGLPWSGQAARDHSEIARAVIWRWTASSMSKCPRWGCSGWRAVPPGSETNRTEEGTDCLRFPLFYVV